MLFTGENQFINEIKERCYETKMNRREPYSMHPVLNKYVQAIKEKNLTEITKLHTSEGFVTDNELTVFKIAAYYGDKEVLAYLITLNKGQVHDPSLFYYACQNCFNNREVILRELINIVDINVNYQHMTSMETPYEFLLRNNDESIVTELLLNNKVDLCLKDRSGINLFQKTILHENEKLMLLISFNHYKPQKSDLDFIYNRASEKAIRVIINLGNGKNIGEYFNNLIDRHDIGAPFIKEIMAENDVNLRDKDNLTPLMRTINKSDREKMGVLLSDKRIDFSMADNNGRNVLMLGFKHLQTFVEITDALAMREDVDLSNLFNIKDVNGDTVLLQMVQNKQIQTLKHFCEKTLVDVNCQNIKGQTPLHLSILNNNYEIFNYLCQKPNVNVNSQDCYGNTALMYALMQSDNMASKLLERVDVNVNLCNMYNQNAMAYYLYKSRENIVQNTSLSKIVEETVPKMYEGFHPTIGSEFLIDYRDITTVEKISKSTTAKLMAKSNLNILDLYGNLILTYIINKKDSEMFNKVLTVDNFDPNRKNKDGLTYIMHVMSMMLNGQQEDKDLMSFFYQLLNHPKIEINATDYFGNTILIRCCESNHLNLLSLVASHKEVKYDQKNSQGQTAMDVAVKNKLWNYVSLFKEKGLDYNGDDKEAIPLLQKESEKKGWFY